MGTDIERIESKPCITCNFPTSKRLTCSKCNSTCCVYCSENIEDFTICRCCDMKKKLDNPKWIYAWVDPFHITTHPIVLTKAYRYARDMEAGDHFPVVKSFKDDNGRLRVVGGAHRTFAARMVGLKLFIKYKPDQARKPHGIVLSLRRNRRPSK